MKYLQKTVGGKAENAVDRGSNMRGSKTNRYLLQSSSKVIMRAVEIEY